MKNSKYIFPNNAIKEFKIHEYDLWEAIQKKKLSLLCFDERTASIEDVDISKFEFADLMNGYIQKNKYTLNRYNCSIFILKKELQAIWNADAETPSGTPENPELTGEEKRELSQLRRQKEKWDQSIQASAKASQFAFSENRRITRNELWTELKNHGFKDIPDTTFEKIWKAIPEQYRNQGGRPKEK